MNHSRIDSLMEISDKIVNLIHENHVNRLEFKCIIVDLIRRTDEDNLSFVESILQNIINERKRNPKQEPNGFLDIEGMK